MKKFRIEVGRFDILQRAGQGDSSQVILRRLRARLWCPFCPGDGYTHATNVEAASGALDRHLALHAERIHWARLARQSVQIGWNPDGSQRIVGGLAMLPDEDEGQQFRHTPAAVR